MSSRIQPTAVACFVVGIVLLTGGEAHAQGKPGKGNQITFAGITPTSGPLAGGTQVKIAGKRFKNISKVTIGGVPLTNLSVNGDDTVITGTTGAGSVAGLADLVIVGSQNTITVKGVFTYLAPTALTITSVNPSSGPITGGTAVTILGANLKDVTSVSIGGVALTGVLVDATLTKITGTTGAGKALGAADLVIVSSSLGTVTKTGAFTYQDVPQTLAVVSGNNQTGTVGTTLPGALVVKVSGVGGAAVAGVTVTFAVTGGGGSLSSTTVATNSQGQASTMLKLGAAPSANTVTATVAGLTAVTFAETGTAAVPATIAIVSGDNQTGVVGTTLAAPFVVVVKDAGGAPLPGITVAFAVATGGGSLSATSVATNAQGQASSTLKLGATPSSNTVTATVTGLTPVTFTATGTAAPAASLAIVSGNTQTGVAGSPLAAPCVVVVKDAGGNALAGVNVAFAVTAGGGSLSATTVATNAQGQASTILTLGKTAGTNTVTATVTGLPAVTFTASGTAGAATALAIASGNNQTGVAGTTLANPLVVSVKDVNGNGVANVTITFAVTAGAGTLTATSVATNAQGQASTSLKLGPAAATNMVTASATGLTTVVFTATGSAAAATQLAIVSGNNQTGLVGTNLANPLVVIAKDSGGNPVSNVMVSFAVTAGGGTLGSTTVATNAQGQASTTLKLGTTATTNTVTATVTGIPAVTFSETATAPTPASIAIVSGDQQKARIGKTLAAPFVVLVKDSTGAALAGVPVTFAITAGGGSLSATSVPTNAQGQASSTLTVGKTLGANTVTAAVAGLGPVTFTATAQPLTYVDDVKAIMTAKCIVCHGPGGVYASKPWTTYAEIRYAVSTNGQPIVTPFVPTASVFIQKTQPGGTMAANVTPAEAQVLLDWVVTGAVEDNLGTLPASKLVIASGDAQSAPVGALLPSALVVTAVDANGKGVAGVPITWTVTAGGGTLSSVVASTDVSGNASARLTLGAAGTNTVTAGASGLTTVTFTATALVGYSGAPLTGSTNPIDQAALVALRANNVEPVGLSSDGEFLRRATIVLLGRLPSAAELDAFLASTDAAKRSKTIDTLLGSSEFAQHWTKDIFGPWTQTPSSVDFDNNGTTVTYQFDGPIQTAIMNDTPLSMVVKNLATGTNSEGMAFQTRHGDFGGTEAADQLMITFTGMTSKCARCHDHPLTSTADDPKWIQDDNYGLYAFFAQSSGDATKIDRTGRRFGTPVQPRWVADGYATAPTGLPTLSDTLATRRAKFGDLLVASNAFARGTAHRIWSEIATPLLDQNQFLKANLDAVKAPALLTALRDEFRRQNTSLKGFLRTCLNSKLFQLTSSSPTTAADPYQGRYLLRRLHSETVQAGVTNVTGIAFGQNDVFTESFGYPSDRMLITERKDDPTTDQALLQMNSPISTAGKVTNSSSQIANLAAAVDGGAVKNIIPRTVVTTAGGAQGFDVTYWDNMDFTGTTVTRVDPEINFDFGSGSPDARIGPDTFSARWTATLKIATAGSYTFYPTADDGVRLYIDGNLVIDKFIDQGPTEYSATLNLTAGNHTIRMDYYENGGGAVAQLRWSSPLLTGTTTYADAAKTLVRAALQRDPTAAEMTAITNARMQATTTRQALEDLAVALTATTEFMNR